MSINLSTNFIASFDGMVHHAYQQHSNLWGTVRQKSGVTGSTHRFPKMGKGSATQRIPQTPVIPMNVGHSNATATLEDWNAAEYTDIFDNLKTNIDEIRELATTLGEAIERRKDQLVIDALEASTPSSTVDENIGGTDTGLNVEKIREASRKLSDLGVPSGDRCWLGSYRGQEQLLGTTEATSSDFNSVKALVDGEVKGFVGFSFKWIETRDEGGLTVATNERVNFAYHKRAVGLAVGMTKRTEVNYIPQMTIWLANHMFSAGAVVIDVAGVCEIATYEA